MRKLLFGAAALAALALAGAADAVTLYSNDFDSAAATDSGVTATLSGYGLEAATAGAWNAAGWAGNYAANRSTGDPGAFTTLTLTGLAAHTTVSISMDLGFLESWDSYDGGCCAPDNLEVWVDGVQVGNLTANNALGSVNDFDGSTLIAQYVQANFNFFYSDTLINAGTATWATFAHSGSTLTLGLRPSGGGWQGGGDEGIGIDAISITYDGRHAPGVPEPAAWALMILGFGAAGAALRASQARAARPA